MKCKILAHMWERVRLHLPGEPCLAKYDMQLWVCGVPLGRLLGYELRQTEGRLQAALGPSLMRPFKRLLKCVRKAPQYVHKEQGSASPRDPGGMDSFGGLPKPDASGVARSASRCGVVWAAARV